MNKTDTVLDMTNDGSTSTAEAPGHANVQLNGAKIRKLRQNKGETIKSLSAIVPMSFSHLAHIETGVRKRARPPLARALAGALGVDLDDIRATS